MFEKVVLWPGHVSRRMLLSSQLSRQSHHAAKWIFYSTGCHRHTLVLSSNLSSANSNLFQTTHRSMASPASVQRKETKVGAHLVYHQYHPEETESGKTPVVLFLPWITANRRSAQRFEDLYGTRGFNVLTVWSSVRHFLWPKSAVPFIADELLKYLLFEVKGDLVIHGMSIGAYIYSIILREAVKHQEAASFFKQHVKGNVFDSLVCGGLNQMAIGVSKLIFKNFVMEKILTTTMLSYFAMTKSHTVEEYDKAIQQFFDNPFIPSALIFYSTVDRMSDPNIVEDIGHTWEKNGAHIRMKKWDDAGHVELFKKHPEEYVERLDEYISFIRPSVRPYKHVVAKL